MPPAPWPRSAHGSGQGRRAGLLTDAYQRRDQLAVIAFRGEQAQLLLAPTRSADLAEQGCANCPPVAARRCRMRCNWRRNCCSSQPGQR
jgi:hypothetical protein